MKYEYDWPMAALTSTVIPFSVKENGDIIILTVIRKNEPHKGQLCFPGGFVNLSENETVEDAAKRELFEETGLHSLYEFSLIAVNSDPNRDSRGRIVDFSFCTYIDEELIYKAKASDDAEDIYFINLQPTTNAPVYRIYSQKELDKIVLAFDHKKTLTNFLREKGIDFA